MYREKLNKKFQWWRKNQRKNLLRISVYHFRMMILYILSFKTNENLKLQNNRNTHYTMLYTKSHKQTHQLH